MASASPSLCSSLHSLPGRSSDNRQPFAVARVVSAIVRTCRARAHPTKCLRRCWGRVAVCLHCCATPPDQRPQRYTVLISLELFVLVKFHIRDFNVVTLGIFLNQIHQCHVIARSRYGCLDQCGRASATQGGFGKTVSNDGLHMGRGCHGWFWIER